MGEAGDAGSVQQQRSLGGAPCRQVISGQDGRCVPCSGRRRWYPGLFSFQPSARGPALVELVPPQVERWMRNPYFQRSREICSAVQSNNLNISGRNQTCIVPSGLFSAGNNFSIAKKKPKKRLEYFIVFRLWKEMQTRNGAWF